MKCDHCEKKATYKRTNRVTQYYQYGNPYHPPQFTSSVKETNDHACQDHFKKFAAASIGGPHRWKEIVS